MQREAGHDVGVVLRGEQGKAGPLPLMPGNRAEGRGGAARKQVTVSVRSSKAMRARIERVSDIRHCCHW